MQQVGGREGFATWNLRAVRVVAIDANLAREALRLRIPVAAGSSVRSSLPVAISRAVATAAEARAVLELYLMAVACLQQLQVLLIVTVEADVIAIVAAVLHHDVLMFLGDEDVVIGIVLDDR